MVAFNNNLTWTLAGTRTGEHVLKMGAQVKMLRSDSFFDSNFRGTWTFPNNAAFLAGTPSRFTQNQGDSSLKRPNELYGFFVQDDWRPFQDLTVNAGLRYDYESAKTQALVNVNPDGEPGPGVSKDRNNFSPRIGFAWSPRGDTKQVIYGGTGMYYDQVILNIIGNARFTPPKVIGIQIDNPTWPDPFGNIVIPPPSVSIIDPDLVTPRNWNSQVGYRRELMPDVGLDVSFLYNRGYDHVGIVNINAGVPGTASSTGANPVRPDPNFVTKSFYTNYGDIRYKALLVDLKKRFSRGFQGGVAYTLSKTENNSFNFVSTMQVPSQPDLSWGPDTQDRRHRIEGHAEINLPWGLQLGTIVDLPLRGAARHRRQRPRSERRRHHRRLGEREPVPAEDRRGRVPRLQLRAQQRSRALDRGSQRPACAVRPDRRSSATRTTRSTFNVDATLQKQFRFGRHGIRLTAEAFNVFNFAQRTAPNISILSSLFGTYSAVEGPRAIQFTMQYRLLKQSNPWLRSSWFVTRKLRARASQGSSSNERRTTNRTTKSPSPESRQGQLRHIHIWRVLTSSATTTQTGTCWTPTRGP